jgi:hypothetical protein
MHVLRYHVGYSLLSLIGTYYDYAYTYLVSYLCLRCYLVSYVNTY